MTSLQRECQSRARMSDAQLAADYLRTLPIHAARSDATLLGWGRRAHRFGEQLSGGQFDSKEPSVTSVAEGGVSDGQILLAQYRTRSGTVILYDDSITLAEQLIDWLDWRRWFPNGTVERAARIHESVHHRLHGHNRGGLRRAIGHPTVALGRIRLYAHILGAEEIAAHGCVQRELGLERSPLLLTEALSCLAGQQPGRGLPRRLTIEEQ